MSTIAEESRAAILEAAERLLIQHGYEALSMRDLARESGFAKATLYHHFRDKQEILQSAVERNLLTVRQRLVAAIESEEEPIDKLRAVVEQYMTLSLEQGHVILATLRESKEIERELTPLIRRYRETFLQPLRSLMEKGIDAGLFRPIDSEMAVISLLGMVDSFVTHRFLVPGDDPGPEVVEHIVSIFLRGTLAEGRSMLADDSTHP